MAELILIEPDEISTKLFDESNEVTLHEDVLEVIFKYKENLCNIFDNIRGTFLVDHFAIKIIDPSNKIMVFSTTPSVEYNLLAQGLWKYDQSFSISYQTDHRFYSWQDAYQAEYFEQLKYLKENKHGFTFGVNLSKKIGSFYLIYSFATRYQKADLLEYYRQYTNELFSVGDYSYKYIKAIYEKHTGITIAAHKTYDSKYVPPFLKLISSKK